MDIQRTLEIRIAYRVYIEVAEDIHVSVRRGLHIAVEDKVAADNELCVLRACAAHLPFVQLGIVADGQVVADNPGKGLGDVLELG